MTNFPFPDEVIKFEKAKGVNSVSRSNRSRNSASSGNPLDSDEDKNDSDGEGSGSESEDGSKEPGKKRVPMNKVLPSKLS